MPTGKSRPALVKVIAIAAALSGAACTPLSHPGYPIPEPQPILGQNSTEVQSSTEALNRLGSDLAQAVPDTEVLNASSGSSACGGTDMPVVRGAFPEQVLFATASDQPAPDAAGALNLLADRVRHDAPGSEITILGHTDSVGSDAYNMDLSRRRALGVMRALVAAGLDPNRLSAVAIGKRQPTADNGTAEGRARNRRVEFLISGCLAANLGVVRAQASADAGTPVDLMRLDPSAAYGLATVGAVSLRQASSNEPVPAALAPPQSMQPPALQPPASMAKPALAPRYQPKMLSPEAQPNALGPAVPF